MSKKPFAKKDGAKVLVATAVAFALIIGSMINPAKMYHKPPSWKIIEENSGVTKQFRFEKSIVAHNVGCYVICTESVLQRRDVGPFFHERRMIATWPQPTKNKLTSSDHLYAELKDSFR